MSVTKPIWETSPHLLLLLLEKIAKTISPFSPRISRRTVIAVAYDPHCRPADGSVQHGSVQQYAAERIRRAPAVPDVRRSLGASSHRVVRLISADAVLLRVFPISLHGRRPFLSHTAERRFRRPRSS